MSGFPIQGGFSRKHFREIPASRIPWDMILPHDKQAQKNHGGQSIFRLAQRGGLSHCEAIAVLEDRDWIKMDQDEAVEKLAKMVADWECTAAQPSCAA